MDKKINNIRIGIAINSSKELTEDVIGERIIDYGKYFKDLFFDSIKDTIKHLEWIIWFKQDDEKTPHFMVDINVDSHNDYIAIRRIIESSDKDPDLTVMEHYYTFKDFGT